MTPEHGIHNEACILLVVVFIKTFLKTTVIFVIGLYYILISFNLLQAAIKIETKKVQHAGRIGTHMFGRAEASSGLHVGLRALCDA